MEERADHFAKMTATALLFVNLDPHCFEDKGSVIRSKLRCPFRQEVTLIVLNSYPSPLTLNDTGFVTLTLTLTQLLFD